MRPVTFIIDRQKGMLYVYSDLWGFYLCGTDEECVLASIVPLAQHLFWKNEQVCMMPESVSDFRHELLNKKTATVCFVKVERMRPPEILQKGLWVIHEKTGKRFFIPTLSNGEVDPAMSAKILLDREREDSGLVLH